MSKPIKILIADDHQLFRYGLKEMLQRNSRMQLVAEAATGAETIALNSTYNPDIILLDIQFPDMDGIAVTKIIRNMFPSVGIIALSMFDDIYSILDMLEAGAGGYILKNATPMQLFDAIEAVQKHEPFFCKEVAAKLSEHSQLQNSKRSRIAGLFTERELQVFMLICQAYSTKDIANYLNLGTRTIEGYRESLKIKTKTNNIVDLVMYAVKHELYRP
jgi:two-component system, NarL family, response regulator NreC